MRPGSEHSSAKWLINHCTAHISFLKFAILIKIVKRYFKIGFFVLIAINFFFASWYAFNSDLSFSSDIARDFLLFGEIVQKKIILIGPKSSVMGLFHGPLWLYINFPAYLIGQGNPIIVEWWWILLTGIFLISCYLVGSRLFDKKIGYLFVLIMSLYMSFHTNSYINPIGAMFLIPAFFFFFIRYLDTKKAKYLFAHFFTIGLIIQFEMAIGIPFLILSALFLFISVIRSKNKRHLFLFLAVLIPLVNFFLFDLRHQFLLTHSVLRYLSPQSGDSIRFSLINLIHDRVWMMLSQVEFIRPDPEYRNLIVSLIFIGFMFLQIKNSKYRKTYLSFIYFFVGYFVMTFINRGPILSFYFYPLFDLVFLVFSSFVTSKYAKLFIVVFTIIYLMNTSTAIADLRSSGKFIGRSETSWKFLNSMAVNVFNGKEKELGYFVYTPDTLGYSPKYALQYQKTLHKEKNISYLAKKPITYVVVAPPAPDNPYLSYTWWRNVRVKITKSPSETITLANGYKIEKYNLNGEEIKIPFDTGIDPGLGFR